MTLLDFPVASRSSESWTQGFGGGAEGRTLVLPNSTS